MEVPYKAICCGSIPWHLALYIGLLAKDGKSQWNTRHFGTGQPQEQLLEAFAEAAAFGALRCRPFGAYVAWDLL